MAATSVSALSTEDSSFLVARANEDQQSNEASKEILKAVTDAAKKQAAEKGKEFMDKKKAEMKAKAEASLEDSKRIAHEIFEKLKVHSLMKMKEIAAHLLELIKQKIADAVDLGKAKAGDLVDTKKDIVQDIVDKKFGNTTENQLVAREFDDFNLEERGLIDDAMVQIFVLLKRSGLINSVIRQSLVDEQVRSGVAKITIELIEADVIPYTDVFEALKDSGLALDVIKFSLTDQETRSGLIQLIIELIPELIRSGVLNPFDYIGGPGMNAYAEGATVSTVVAPTATAAA